MHFFRFLQKYLIGFKLRLGLGHSRTFTELSISHFFCVFRVTVLLEGEYSACLEVLNALGLVFIKAISTFWSIEVFFYSGEPFYYLYIPLEVVGHQSIECIHNICMLCTLHILHSNSSRMVVCRNQTPLT